MPRRVASGSTPPAKARAPKRVPMGKSAWRTPTPAISPGGVTTSGAFCFSAPQNGGLEAASGSREVGRDETHAPPHPAGALRRFPAAGRRKGRRPEGRSLRPDPWSHPALRGRSARRPRSAPAGHPHPHPLSRRPRPQDRRLDADLSRWRLRRPRRTRGHGLRGVVRRPRHHGLRAQVPSGVGRLPPPRDAQRRRARAAHGARLRETRRPRSSQGRRHRLLRRRSSGTPPTVSNARARGPISGSSVIRSSRCSNSPTPARGKTSSATIPTPS